MKIIDYAIIFVVVLMPIVLTVSIDLNSQIKAENVEVYYKNLIDSAISDASQEMKELENDDIEIDYGYDKEENKKISINAEHAINTFLNSLFFNLGIRGNKQAEALLMNYIPATLVIDYNGLHVYSMENFEYRDKNGQLQRVNEHVLKPKKYYSYSYDLEKYCSDDKTSIYGCNAKDVKTRIVPGNAYNVIFTLSDYITFLENDASGDYVTYSRYMKDMKNKLFPSVSIFDPRYSPSSVEVEDRQNELIESLKEKRKDLIINMVTDELSYAISKHNEYARSIGIEYTFQFSRDIAEDWYTTVQDVGVMSFVQGIALGNNQYLNHYAFGGGELNYTQKYLVTRGTESLTGYNKLYHKTTDCEIYKSPQALKDLKPLYYSSKYKAASAGYYPCPVCISLSSSINMKEYIPPTLKVDGPYLASDTGNINLIKKVTAGENIKFIVTCVKGSENLTVSLTREKILINNFISGTRIEETTPDAFGNRRFIVYIDGITKYQLSGSSLVEIGGVNSKKSITIKGDSITDSKNKNADTITSNDFTIEDIKGDPKMTIIGPTPLSVYNGGTITYRVNFEKGYNNINRIDLRTSRITLNGFTASVVVTKNDEFSYTITLSNINNINTAGISKNITIDGSAIMDIAGSTAASQTSASFRIEKVPPSIEISGPLPSNTITAGGTIYYEASFTKGTDNIGSINLNEGTVSMYGFTADLSILKLSDTKYRVILNNVRGTAGSGKYIRIADTSITDINGLISNQSKNSNTFTLQ